MEPSRRYERTLVAILFFTWGTVFLDRMSQLYLAPFFAPEFQLSNQQIGFLASVVAITWALSGYFFGALSDQFGRRRVLIPAIFAFSTLSWISGLVHSFHQLLWIRALMGVAEGPCWSVITALIEESSPPNRRGRNVGLVVSAAALVGLAAAPVLTTQVASRYGWRWAFFVAGMPGIIMGILLWKYVREPEKRESLVHQQHHGSAAVMDYLSILRYRNVWLSCLGASGFMCWLFLLNVFAPLYITEVIRQAPTTAGFLLGATGLGSFFLGFLFPSLSDRIGRKPILILLAILSAIVPLALQVPDLYKHLWLLAAIVFCTNGGQAIASLIIVLVPAESVPPQFVATAIGLATLVGEIIGATLAPALGGAMAEKFTLRAPLLMSAGGMALLLLATLFLSNRTKLET
ncbi:MAG TPA: MFS transporter [Terriglobales bacterium]|nr:MFS transporter [Terriglobales bacterium]